MNIRNLTFFQLDDAYRAQLTPCALDNALAANILRQPLALQPESHGFAPVPGQGGSMTMRHGQYTAFRYASAKRLLPRLAINTAWEERMAERAAKGLEEPHGKERRRLRDELVMELLPRAFVLNSYTDCVLDTQSGWIWLGTTSAQRCDAINAVIRNALDSWPATPPQCDFPIGLVIASKLTSWLRGEVTPPSTMAIGSECVLREPGESGAFIRAKNQELFSDEIAEHLAAGKQCERLELTFADRVTFSIDADFKLHKLTLHDVCSEDIEVIGGDEWEHEKQKVFIDEVARLLRVLEKEFLS